MGVKIKSSNQEAIYLELKQSRTAYQAAYCQRSAFTAHQTFICVFDRISINQEPILNVIKRARFDFID